MQITVYYEGWQMECCGTAFGIGDIVAWHCDIYDTSDGLLKNAEYMYEAHSQAKYEVTGKVIKIDAISYDYESKGNISYPVSYTTQSNQKAKEFLADGFLVFLDNAQVKS